MLVFGVLDHMQPHHEDRLWAVGWIATLYIAGLPLSPIVPNVLPDLTGTSVLVGFLIGWVAYAASSFFFWLIAVPFVYRRLTNTRSTGERSGVD